LVLGQGTLHICWVFIYADSGLWCLWLARMLKRADCVDLTANLLHVQELLRSAIERCKTWLWFRRPVSPEFENTENANHIPDIFRRSSAMPSVGNRRRIFEKPQNAHNLHVWVFNQLERALLNKIANLQ
jgi:hypothetical protein